MEYMLFAIIPTFLLGLSNALVTYVSHNVSETANASTTLWNSSTHSNCSINITNPQTARGYITIGPSGNTLLILRSLDLDIQQDFPNPTLIVGVNCSEGGDVQLTVNIIPENEFRPTFLYAPYYQNVTDGTPANTTIFSLAGRVIDGDAIRYGTIVEYGVVPYQIGQLDGRPFFSVNNETGNVTTRVDIDYENLGRTYYILNIIATDDGGWMSPPSQLNITIVDVDDTPPSFLKPNCFFNTGCLVDHYQNTIDIHFHGSLQNMTPAPVYARDGDRGVDARIIYSIFLDNTNVSDSGFSNSSDTQENELAANLAIDNTTGTIQVVEPFVNLTNITLEELSEPFYVNVTIVAKEDTDLQRSANVSFTLVVYHAFPTEPPSTTLSTASTTTQPTSTTNATETTTVENDDGANSLLLVYILVPCVVSVLCLFAVVVFALLKRQRMRENKYQVKEKERETRLKHHGDMMDSLPATVASPYDLVGAYANFQDEEKATDDKELSISKLNENVYFGGLYKKVKMKPPRQMKMRAVDIVEADMDGDVEDGAERDGGDDLVVEAKEAVETAEKHEYVNTTLDAEADNDMDTVSHSNGEEKDNPDK